jgi:hypothetical protein
MSGHPPEADQFPELTEPTRTAVEPTTKQIVRREWRLFDRADETHGQEGAA